MYIRLELLRLNLYLECSNLYKIFTEYSLNVVLSKNPIKKNNFLKFLIDPNPLKAIFPTRLKKI